MDNFAIKDLLAGLAKRGFEGGIDELADLVQDAQCVTRERAIVALWKKVPGAPALLQRIFAHARQRGMCVSGRSMPAARVLLVDRHLRPPAVRLAKVDLTSQCVILEFYRGEESVGQRRMAWDGSALPAVAQPIFRG